MSGEINRAFILGAGLGTRLRPMTDSLPKPLVPVGNKPLITYALDHLIAELNISEFMVNTHHCPEAYVEAFSDETYRGRKLSFRHENILLDTAGGIDNIRDWLPETESVIVYNGDILTDMPLAEAFAHHRDSGNLVTMLLRSKGDELRVGFDPGSGLVVDLRGKLRPEWEKRFQFTGVYFVAPDFLPFIRPGKIESVVLPFLEAIRQGGQIGGLIVDEGHWSDLGNRDSYLDALSVLGNQFPGYGKAGYKNRISNRAVIHESAQIDELSTVGEGAQVGENVVITESVIWPGANVMKGSRLNRVVVRSSRTATGKLENCDI